MILKYFYILIIVIATICITGVVTSNDTMTNTTVTNTSVFDNFPEHPTYRQVSDVISAVEPDDKKFVERIKQYVYGYIEYQRMETNEVRSPERAWNERIGDCSEMSLLISAMLNPRVKAHVIHGEVIGVDLHDSVEYHIDHYYYRIDEKELPGFVKYGDGLYPFETII